MIQFVQLLVTWTGENFGKKKKKKKDRVSKEPDLIREQKYLLHYFKRQVLCFSDASCFKNSFPQLFQDLSVLFYEIDFEDVISFTWSKLQIISHSFFQNDVKTRYPEPLGFWSNCSWSWVTGPGGGGNQLPQVGAGGRHPLRGQRLPTIRAVSQR